MLDAPQSQVLDILYAREDALFDDAIEAISADAFGPGRFARAAARVREMAPHDRELSLVAMVWGVVVGSVRQTPIHVGTRPALMLGPLAVLPAYKSRGIGSRLMHMAADAAREAGESAIVLVGDPPYYGPLGYRPLPPGSIAMPGPVDPRRLLGKELVPGALEGLAGEIGPRR